MKRKIVYVIFIVALLISGCTIQLGTVKYGQENIMNQELIEKIRPGFTDQRMLEEWFGKPEDRVTYNTGTEKWRYVYSKREHAWGDYGPSPEWHILIISFRQDKFVQHFELRTLKSNKGTYRNYPPSME